MEGEHRHLNGKGQKEGQEQPDLVRGVDIGFEQLQEIKGQHAGLVIMHKIDGEDGQQHKYAAEQGVQEEFNGRIELARPTPDANQKVHGDKHDFPEHVEEKEVQRHEDAQHARLQEQQGEVIFLFALLNGGKRADHRDCPQQRGQKNQQQANPIYAQEILDTDGIDPARLLDELELVCAGIKGQENGE